MLRKETTDWVTETLPKGSLWTRGLSMAETEIDFAPVGRWSNRSPRPAAQEVPARAARAYGSRSAAIPSSLLRTAEVRSAAEARSSRSAGEAPEVFQEEHSLQGMAA